MTLKRYLGIYQTVIFILSTGLLYWENTKRQWGYLSTAVANTKHPKQDFSENIQLAILNQTEAPSSTEFCLQWQQIADL